MTPITAARTDANTGRWVLVATILASSMVFIDGSALNVALPAIQASLHADAAALLWVVNAYLLMLAALILVGGALGDEFGRKRAFMAGIALFVLASCACGLAPNVELLIAARAVAGLGGALTIPESLAILSAFFQAGERGRAIGTWSAVTTIVTVAGPVLGGILSNAGLWRGVFLINVPIGIAALVVLYARVPESRGEHGAGSIDWIGALLVITGLFAATYAFISAPERGFGDASIIGAVTVGTIALVAFVIVEWKGTHPMVPLRLFASRTFSGTNLLTLFLYGGLSLSSFFLALNLVQAQGYSLAQAGFAFTPFALFLTALSRWAGGLVDRYGPRLPLVVGPAVVGAANAWMAFVGLTAGAEQYWTTFFPGIAILGIGMGITVAPLSTTVMNAVATERAGVASGVNNAVSRMAGVLAIAIGGAIAIAVFANALDVHTAPLTLDASARAALRSGAAQLGALTVPSQVPPQSSPAVAVAIRLAFVDAFNVVTLLCAGASWLAALISAWLVESRPEAVGG